MQGKISLDNSLTITQTGLQGNFPLTNNLTEVLMKANRFAYGPVPARPRFGGPLRAVSRLLLVALLPAALAACGGGGADSAGAGSAPVAAKETANGPVTGFGSLIVEGMRYDDSAATVIIDIDPTAPQTGAASGIALGMQVEVAATGSTAETITVSAAVIGRIQSVGNDSFVAAGQTIAVSTDPAAPTYFEGASGIIDLAVGNFVEVHGSRDAAGVIVASRVELKDPRSAQIVRVVGTVGGLDPAGKTFTIGGLLVAYDDNTRIAPAGQALADGQLVVVFSNTAVAGSRLQAKAIRVTRRQAEDGSAMRIGGLIRGLDFTAKSFVLDGFQVNGAGATYVGGTSADLANGRRIRVIGSFEAGKVVAREIRFRRHQEGDHEVGLTGAITDFVTTASFRIRGVPVDSSASGVVFVGGTAGNLGEGVVVRVDGDVDGNVVKAARIEFIDSGDATVRNFVGIVSGYESATGAFRLGNAAMRLSSTTTYRNADFSIASVSDFGNDDRVQVRGQWRAGVFEVTEVVFRPGIGVVVTRTGGTIYSVDATAGVFRVNGVIVTTDGATTFTGSRENLRNGVTVTVEGRLENGRLLAIIVVIGGPDRTTGTAT